MGEPQPLSQHGRPRGRLSSWLFVGVLVGAFIVGGIALILHLWVLFWVCVAVSVLSMPIGKAIGVMNDTVQWTLPMTAATRHRYPSVSAAAAQHRHENRERDRARSEAEEPS